MADQQQQPAEQQLNIELTEEMAEGTYANLAIVSSSMAEFVLDFINIVPNMPKAKVKSRIIMTPLNAKRLMRNLVDNIKRFEAANGVIKDQDNPGLTYPISGPTAQA